MQLKDILVEVDSLKTEIDKLRPLKPEVEQRIRRKFRLDWNYHSNAIEGNTLTLGETRAFLLEGLTANGKPMKDHLDIRGHDDLLTFLQTYILKKELLTEADIRGMHEILLKDPYETDAFTSDGRIIKRKVRLGEYKTEPNAVRMGSGEIHQYTAPQDVGPKMAELVAWHRHAVEKNDPHPLIQAAVFHHRFVSIHPFDDGNGRMARILMNLILMRAGFPPVVIKFKGRDAYVAALRKADVGEMEGITSFIGQNLIESENLFLRGARGEAIEDADDVDKEVALLKQELKDAPMPTVLTWEVQQRHIEKELIPFLNRLSAKCKQFDEMFDKTIAEMSGSIRIIGASSSVLKMPGFQGLRSELISRVMGTTNQKQLVLNYKFGFRWEGFLLDGPNDFSVEFHFQIDYQDRKMWFHSDEPKINNLMLYQHWFSEDEIKQLLHDFTKQVLDLIQLRRLSSQK